MPDYSLLVNRDELIDAVQRIVGFRKGARSLVRLTYHDGTLSIATPNVTAGAAAEGVWPTEVRTPSAWLRSLARVPPTADPVPVTFDGARVRIGTTGVTGRAVGPVEAPRVPADPQKALGPGTSEAKRRDVGPRAAQRRRLAAQSPDVVRSGSSWSIRGAMSGPS